MARTEVKKLDMTIGNPVKVLITFALPIFIGQLFQQFYNIADIKIIGMELGDDAIAAMNSIASVYGILIGIANGLNNGCAITVARMYGAKNGTMLRRTLAHMIVVNFAAVGLFTSIGLFFTDLLMEIMKVPASLYGDARVYLTFILCGMVTTIAYNMCAAVLRSVGDSRTPLYFLIFSSIVNIGLDCVFVMVLDWGVGGAAAATIIAQALSAALCFVYIYRKVPELHISSEDFVFDGALLRELLAMGFSMGLITSLVSFGSAAVSRANNALSEAGWGNEVLTANSSARRIDGLIMMPMSTLGTALSTFVSQNRGAGNFERISKGIRSALLIGGGWCAMGIAVIYAMGGFLVQLITDTENPEIIKYAVYYMRINAPFFLALMVLLIFRSVLQGFGKKLVPIVTAAAELVLKFFAAAVLVPHFGFLGICVAEPAIWLITGVFVAIVYVHNMKRFKYEIKERQAI
ncbi:MAG: polysaccharide biosynthesis C-terminal domain-containing protein [Clostridia bacterium]|nr:polysaccharide biosynthesis C-terminal domain-containing protein [Clostridia bacterium]